MSDREYLPLADWEMAFLEPGAAESPSALVTGIPWSAARAPGTAASALRAAGTWSLDVRRDFDATDVWYRRRFSFAPRENARVFLCLDGLATLADVWLNGEHLLGSDNMFHAHEIDATSLIRSENEVAMRFRSLGSALKARRPRPKWRTRLVDQQQLRWVRTTLLGRIPAWSPPVAPVGPWRAVTLETRAKLAGVEARLRPFLDGSTGVLEVEIRMKAVGITGCVVRVGEHPSSMALSSSEGETVARGVVRVPHASLWWPHTHGEQPLYEVRASIDLGTEQVDVDLGRTGFRTIERVDPTGFGLRVNGVDVFFRGACWAPLDVVSLSASLEVYREALLAAREAGMNMIRVGGTMVYEDDVFYDLCDELGIAVFQDFMLANMDYPAEDEAFVASLTHESKQFLERVSLSPALAVMCGGSEVEQQAAMLGLPREHWTNTLFADVLPEQVRGVRPDMVYIPSTPTGGAMPFHVDRGVAHYFGVGAYLRPFDDARRSGVRFAAECLAFANVPTDETLEGLLRDDQSPPHHPAWKARVPRDNGPGWDFDDVRDHYVGELFGVDAAQVRYADRGRYLAMGRVASGEAMARAYAEWRRAGSVCRGALIWFYRDLWPGAGWGVVDAHGRPKSVFFYLKRALSPVALFALDEGLNGLDLSAVNDGPRPVDGEIALRLLRDGLTPVAEATVPMIVPARGTTSLRVDAILPHFLDTTYAYRFGPPGCDTIVARLSDRVTGARLAEAFHFPLGFARPIEDVGLEATASPSALGSFAVTLRTRKLAQAIALDVRGFLADDDHFHLAPGDERVVTLRPHGRPQRFEGSAKALNAPSPVRIRTNAASS